MCVGGLIRLRIETIRGTDTIYDAEVCCPASANRKKQP